MKFALAVGSLLAVLVAAPPALACRIASGQPMATVQTLDQMDESFAAAAIDVFIGAVSSRSSDAVTIRTGTVLRGQPDAEITLADEVVIACYMAPMYAVPIDAAVGDDLLVLRGDRTSGAGLFEYAVMLGSPRGHRLLTLIQAYPTVAP